MPRIVAKADNLNELNKNFEQVKLGQPVFLNSVPKCGTHLLRNIVRMFVPVKQQYHDAFIQIPLLHKHLRAFSKKSPVLSWGHLLFSDNSAIALEGVNHVVLYRDPYDWVLARTRFFLSDTFQGKMEHLKGSKVSVDEVMNMMIFGIYDKAPHMQDIYMHNAVAWIGTKAKMLKMEDLVHAVTNLDSDDAEQYFASTLKYCGIPTLPDDWRERVRIGSDRKQSGTARENLVGLKFVVPDVLPDEQKRLVDFAIPGLRELLGYS
jgi:hypothetical protein